MRSGMVIMMRRMRMARLGWLCWRPQVRNTRAIVKADSPVTERIMLARRLPVAYRLRPVVNTL